MQRSSWHTLQWPHCWIYLDADDRIRRITRLENHVTVDASQPDLQCIRSRSQRQACNRILPIQLPGVLAAHRHEAETTVSTLPTRTRVSRDGVRRGVKAASSWRAPIVRCACKGGADCSRWIMNIIINSIDSERGRYGLAFARHHPA
jgi:hypothetical protein